MTRDEAERLLDEHEEATADATMQHSSDFKSERKKQRYRESRAAVIAAMTRATPPTPTPVSDRTDCQRWMMKNKPAWPRTCPRCKLGPCAYPDEPLPAAPEAP